MSSCAASSCMFCPRLRAHPQLRLPCQPPAGQSAAALLRAAAPLNRKRAATSANICRSAQLLLAVSVCGGTMHMFERISAPNFGSALHRKPPGVPHDRTSQNALRWHRLRRTGNPCSFASARRSAETLGRCWQPPDGPLPQSNAGTTQAKSSTTASAHRISSRRHSKYISA